MPRRITKPVANKTNKFSKSDLESGMHIKLRKEDDWRIVLLGTYEGDILLNEEGDDYLYLKDYNEDLTDQFDSQFDIVQVVRPCPRDILSPGRWSVCRPDYLYNREDTVEVSMEEIAEKFGVDVKRLRIKE